MATLEAVIAIPVVVLAICMILQVAMWWYSGQVARTAAQQGARTAAQYGSTNSDGRQSTLAYLATVQGAGRNLDHVQVGVTRTASTVTVTITADSIALVGGFDKHISVSASHPIERYVPEGSTP